jgi:deazaflavin-dependent oxidoreductase (nitroreductase family)
MSIPDRTALLRALELPDGTSAHDRHIDITTTGARTGLPRRIEIALWHVDRAWYLGSGPARRGWFANLRAHPELTVHLKNELHADIPARATVITDRATRARVLAEIIRQAGLHDDLEPWIEASPLVEVHLDLAATSTG